MADVGGSASSGRMWCSVPEKFQLHLAMLALQFGYAGFHVVSRAALNMGVSKLVFPVYRNIIALLLLLPFAYFLEKKERPALTLNFALQFFLLALVGITANQGFYLLGLENTSPTFASAIQNSVPAITFLMAALLRIEKVRINRKDGIAKVLGTICCVAGASVITLYTGPAPVLKKYPARLSVTSYTCFFGLIQFMIIAAFMERDPQAWIFHSGGELFTILYAGVVASGIAFAVQIWCIDRGGPVFVAVYQPVQTLVVAIMASIALGEEFYLGGIIGAALIIVGIVPGSMGQKRRKEVLGIGKSCNSDHTGAWNQQGSDPHQDFPHSATAPFVNRECLTSKIPNS
ncbi:WAT1-RELATED PROTEIN [Salix purpurea]|uniref:WAT1-related protein n=1 Tax=Salix purpurea TaxID=77065 RepID=A0A9Q0WXQ9_SALPP|nr:WAT1-RELATED PROTEIN [Salix purpurea]